MSDRRKIAIEHLSLLHVSPPDLVLIAAKAGFDSVGIRVFHPESAWNPWSMLGRSPMLEETLRRLADTGLSVLDIETVVLRTNLVPSDYEPVLEAGARLGATFLNVMGEDSDLQRTADTFATLVSAAADYGLRPVLEPIFHKGVRNLEEAVDVVNSSEGGGIQIDVLHFFRFGGDLDALRTLDPNLFGYLQVNDAYLMPPDSVEERSIESRTRRLLPGQGELPVSALIASMPPSIPLALEAPAASPDSDPASFARRAHDAILAVIDGAGDSSEVLNT